MKKYLLSLLAIAMVFIMIFSLSCCTTDEPGAESTDGRATTTKTVKPTEAKKTTKATTDAKTTKPAKTTEPPKPDAPTPPEGTPINLVQHLTKPAEFAWDKATTVECEVDGYTSAGATYKKLTNETTGYTFGYIFMKQTVAQPYIKVPFTVAEDGTYTFVFELMAYDSTVPRTGLIQVDDGAECYYIYTEHGNDRHLTTEYYTGITVELTAGEHFIYLYLAEDFNNSTIKSVYFDKFSFAKQ